MLERGQQIKVASMLYRKAKTKSLVIPTLARRGNVSASNNYEGATACDRSFDLYSPNPLFANPIAQPAR